VKENRVKRLYFEIIEFPQSIRVLRMRSHIATVFYGEKADTIPTDSAIEVLGTISRFDAMTRGFVKKWGERHEVAKQLDELSDEDHMKIAELAQAKSLGFETKFLQDLDEVK
jgi:hypothetical protein